MAVVVYDITSTCSKMRSLNLLIDLLLLIPIINELLCVVTVLLSQAFFAFVFENISTSASIRKIPRQ